MRKKNYKCTCTRFEYISSSSHCNVLVKLEFNDKSLHSVDGYRYLCKYYTIKASSSVFKFVIL